MKITSAAIKYHDTIYAMPAPSRHSDVLRHMFEQHDIVDAETRDQGFLTDAGNFVDRTEAARIAYKAGQTKTLHHELTTEDVW